jgi:hypothetical protein
MHDFHTATIKFLHPLLQCKQRQLTKAANLSDYAILSEEFENLRRRLCLEIVYAIEARPGGWGI